MFVSLCDNEYQGIVPVPKNIGNGDDPNNNLYWGLSEGVRGNFNKNKKWELVYNRKYTNTAVSPIVYERCVYRSLDTNFFLIADAYRGREIYADTVDFLSASINHRDEYLSITNKGVVYIIPVGRGARNIAYIGHNGLMDFALPNIPIENQNNRKNAIVLCCKSMHYFEHVLRKNGANPVLLTKQLMYPASCILENVMYGMMRNESKKQLLHRAAEAYAKNQNISVRSASGIFYEME